MGTFLYNCEESYDTVLLGGCLHWVDGFVEQGNEVVQTRRLIQMRCPAR